MKNTITILVLMTLFSCIEQSDSSDPNHPIFENIPTPPIYNESDIGLKEILNEISILAIDLDNDLFTTHQVENHWIGQLNGASENQINEAEKRIGYKLPKEYLEFIKITNGFSAPSRTEPNFLPIEKIGLFKSLDPSGIHFWESDEVLGMLNRSILIAGLGEEIQFLLIPPLNENDDWQFWEYDNWIPGGLPFGDIKSYFLQVSKRLKINEEIRIFLDSINEFKVPKLPHGKS